MVAVLIEIVTTIKELPDFIDVLLWVANLIINHASASHYFIVIESVVIHVCLLGVSVEIVKLIYVDAIP